MSTSSDPLKDAESKIDSVCSILQQTRKRPLLVMYYSDDYGMIEEEDMEKTYREFRKKRLESDTNQIPELDVLIHTSGGNPDIGYMIGQIIRDFAKHVTFLIPFYATSAGTILCFSGNEILFGAHAYLSPIDIYLGKTRLMAIDGYIDFAVECRRKTEEMLQNNDFTESSTDVEVRLLERLVNLLKPLSVGDLFKMRYLTGYYARFLLSQYMFGNEPNRDEVVNNIVRNVLFNFPTHNYYLDFHGSQELGLKVNPLSQNQSDMAREIVNVLQEFDDNEIICKKIEDNEGYTRQSFIRLYT